MARIRSIKPSFFRHERLFEAEVETGLPLRVAFAGLWICADREGRFRWRPRELKLDCLPFDDVDFSRVLDALWTRGFVVRYAVNGEEFGAIPSWNKHQVVNNRETPSEIPEPNNTNMLTREERVDDACPTPLKQDQGEGKGREREGERNSVAGATGASAPPPTYTDSRHELWAEGKLILQQLGVPKSTASQMIGKWLKDTKDDAQLVLGAIQRARDHRPSGDVIAWITQALGSPRKSAKRDEQSTSVLAAFDRLGSRVRDARGMDYQPVQDGLLSLPKG